VGEKGAGRMTAAAAAQSETPDGQLKELEASDVKDLTRAS